MHGLTTYAKRLNLVPKTQPTAKFAQLFWNNLTSKGRVNELKLGISLYFMYGFGEGIKVAKANQKLGLSMLKTKRMAINEAGLEMKNDKNIRHMVEVLVEDIGMAAITEKVKKPLEGIKIAGYVGCQTNRPFGIDGESFENPQYLDNMVEAVGAEPIRTYEKKVSCCGGALAFSEPDKSFNLIKPILESAMDNGADMIVTPCPVCQMNTEVYQDKINEKFGTNFNIPVVYYSTLMLVAFGRSAADSALNGQVIQAQKLNKIVG
ncbi:MAG: heterodisulfide reductase [gamma proteobacterium symbiont of Bathyaustriella thionipta]|nr:heterodisulfide reductase [gamma proteobacterium symbiont of Bathyaustriella thionipta]MCU7950208.1 heterodisulfide reductase [gamma proteobacterium symbiont of Bathyaustriella thionipta]